MSVSDRWREGVAKQQSRLFSSSDSVSEAYRGENEYGILFAARR